MACERFNHNMIIRLEVDIHVLHTYFGEFVRKLLSKCVIFISIPP
jgi:hypothetical protein